MEKKEHSIRYRNNKYLYTCRDYFHDLPEYHRKLSLSQLQMREEFKIMERKYGTWTRSFEELFNDIYITYICTKIDELVSKAQFLETDFSFEKNTLVIRCGFNQMDSASRIGWLDWKQLWFSRPIDLRTMKVGHFTFPFRYESTDWFIGLERVNSLVKKDTQFVPSE